MEHGVSIAQLYSFYLQSRKVCTDTRTIEEGCIFFALKGPNFNGNTFALQALEKGAAYVVVDEDVPGNERVMRVQSVLKTLQLLAHYHRELLEIPVIAIGGSNGKTTTKELVNAVLSKKYATHATKGNLNNYIGLPLTLLSMPENTEMLVLEMGTNRPGDMEELCDIAAPEFGLVTNIGKEHLEGFGSLEGVAKEESVLYFHLLKNNGIAFVNANDEWLTRMASRLEKSYKYGYNTADKKIFNAEFKGELLKANPQIEAAIDTVPGTIKARLAGEYNFQNIMAAAAIGHYFGVDGADIKTAIEEYNPTNNRSQLLQKGSNLLLMDCYNANPSSMEVALRSFATAENPNKIVVIGDMFELGDHADAEHEAIARLCSELGFTTIYCVGPVFAKYASIMKAGSFLTSDALKHFFESQVYSNCYFFFKASRGIALEKAVEGIK